MNKLGNLSIVDSPPCCHNLSSSVCKWFSHV